MRMTCTPQDQYLIPAMKDEAFRRGLTLSGLIEEYCREGLKNAHPYLIIVYYTDGTIRRETDFVSYGDMAESIRAFADIINGRAGERFVKGFRAYSNGKMVAEGGEVPPIEGR